MRDLLVSKNLKLRYDDDATRMQEPPSAEELEEYRGNPEAGPRRSNLKIDWHSSLASRWNKAAIHMLAEIFLENIHNGVYRRQDIEYENWMKVEVFHESLTDKLMRSKYTYLNSLPADQNPRSATAEETNRSKKLAEQINRRTNRRRTVKIKHFSSCFMLNKTLAAL